MAMYRPQELLLNGRLDFVGFVSGKQRHGDAQIVEEIHMRTQQEGGEYTGSYEDNVSSLADGSVGQVHQGPVA